MDTYSFILGVKTTCNNNKLKNLKDLFDFSTLFNEHSSFGNANKKIPGKKENETPDSICLDKFVCLTSEAYS